MGGVHAVMAVTFLDNNTVSPASRSSFAISVGGPAQANDIQVVGIRKENAATITPPDGSWTLLDSEVTNVTTESALWVYWKRCTGADSGTYTFSWTGSVFCTAVLAAFRGCETSGSPWVDHAIKRNPGNGSALISETVNSYSGGAGYSVVSTWATASRTWTAPSGWTRLNQLGDTVHGYKESMPSSTTGSIDWTGSGNDYYKMFLGVLGPPGFRGSGGPATYAIIGGVKKPATLYAIEGGVKKATTAYAIIGGVKKQ